MRVKLEETPLDLRRRVANKLESVRGTSMAQGGDDASLGEMVCPVYRPDIKGIAYWEFEIAGLKNVQPRGHKDKSSGLGFIFASTGKHDIPIPHWSLSIEPYNRALEAMAGQGKVAQIFKVDTLTYVAEDNKHNYLYHFGQLPMQIGGTNTELQKLNVINSAIISQKSPSKDDSSPGELILKTEAVKVPKTKLQTWESWINVKRDFAKAFKPNLKALAQESSEAWKIEDLITSFGEGIHEGASLVVPMLQPGKAKVTGEGIKFVKLTVLDRKHPAVKLETLPSGEKKEANFQLVFSYQDGTSETLLFFVVPKDTPSNYRSVLPHLTTKNEGGIIP